MDLDTPPTTITSATVGGAHQREPPHPLGGGRQHHHHTPAAGGGGGETPHPLTKSTTLHEHQLLLRSKRGVTPPTTATGRDLPAAPAVGSKSAGGKLRRSVRISGSTSKRLSEHAIHVSGGICGPVVLVL